MTNEFLLIEAAGGEKANPKVMGLAYSGGKMTLSGWRYPVVVDLSGLEIPESIPLLANHSNQVASRIGVVAARVEGGTLVIDGEILASGGEAQAIVEQAKAAGENGGNWQLSIGAEVKEAVLVRGSGMVNGQEIVGPFYHVTRALLREVSVVAVGADSSTRLQVAAKFAFTGFQGDKAMDEQENTQVSGKDRPERIQGEDAPQGGKDDTVVVSAVDEKSAGDKESVKAEAERAVKVERERVAEIQAICSGEFPKIEREAISAGWNADQTRSKVLLALREARPQSQVGIVVAAESSPAESGMVLEAALCLRSGMTEDGLVAEYGEKAVVRARRERDISLQQLFAECARIEGKSIPRSFGNDTIRAAFSTLSLPGILNSVANKRLLKSFQAQPLVATQLCSEGELTDFKESERYRLTDVGDLEPVAPDGELKHGGLKEDKAVNQLETFGKVFALTRQMIFNDDLGAFLKVPDGMGARAARKIDQLFFTRLMANPNNLFSTAHKNYKFGADTALSGDSLATAIQMFLDQVDSDGQPINVNPKYLLVPTSLKITARELLNSLTFIATGTSTKARIPTYNALADEDLTIVASPYLSNANYGGASDKAWYLFADPGIVDTFEIGYLRGRRTPTVEQGETDFDTLGIKFRVFFDLGVREQDWRGVFKAKGEA